MGNTGVKRAYVEDGDPHVHYQLRDRVGNVINPTGFWNRLDPGKAAVMGDIDPWNPSQFAPPPQANRPLGIFSGKPMPDYPFPPPIFGLLDDSRANGDDEANWYTRGRRLVGPE
jgi:hypothetical protein